MHITRRSALLRLAATTAGGALVACEARARKPVPGVETPLTVGLWKDIERRTVPAHQRRIATLGYSAVGSGPATYVIDEDQSDTTATRWRRRSADGRWFRIEGERIDPRQMGAIYDGAAFDDAAQDACIAAALAVGAEIDLLSGVVRRRTALRLPTGLRIHHGDLTIDYANAASGPEFAARACLFADSGRAVKLPPLGGDLRAGGTALRLTTTVAGSLRAGDLIAIYDPRDYSWIRQWAGGRVPAGQFAEVNRANYRAGEMAVVKDVSGAVVSLQGALRAPYRAADVEVWKMPNQRLLMAGGTLTVRASNRVDVGFRGRRLRNSVLRNLRVEGGRIAAIELTECFDIAIVDGMGRQDVRSGAGEDYGLCLVSCEKISVQGDFTGFRHGAAVGAAADLPGNLCLPWRNIEINVGGGRMRGLSEVNAFGGHGCGEYLKLGGLAVGGLLIAGNHTSAACEIVAPSPGWGWPLIHATEMWGWDHDLGKCRVRGAGVDPVPNGLGLLNFGSGGGAPDAGCVRGGVLRLPGLIEAPDSIRPIRMFSNDVPPGIRLKVVAATTITAAPRKAIIEINTRTGANVFDVDFEGYSDRSGNVELVAGSVIAVRNYRSTGGPEHDPGRIASGG